MTRRTLTAMVLTIGLAASLRAEDKPQEPQYAFEDIIVPAASADEPIRPAFSAERAVDYLERGAKAWTEKRDCVSCHTNGCYMLTRPALTALVGPPAPDMRVFFVEQLAEMKKEDRAKLREGLKPTQVAYVAAGLAEWDSHVAKTLSEETKAALELMFDVQSEDGSFRNLDCWPPLESSHFHGATVAAMAAATAPGWLASLPADSPLTKRHEKLKSYLTSTKPANDYESLLLLWAAARSPSLLLEARRMEIIDRVFSLQRADSGWALRALGTPESWGGGNRAGKLRAEPEFADPPSDGHATGLAVLALREAGVPKTDPRIVKAVAWIKSNQRESGRWWTRSLNTDKQHYITYSGACYPLLALAKCDAW
ncbi:MAG: hypothetical protein ACKV19_07865 [Verrucomicrobiales bacterium]